MKQPVEKPCWHIAGIGALGSLLAGYFCHKGLEVNLILKESQLETYQNTHLNISTAETQFTCHPNAARVTPYTQLKNTAQIQSLKQEPIRFLICCVKAYDITPLLIRLKAYLTPQSIIILIHNGLGVLDEIKQKLPQLRIICGISTLGAYLEKPFSVKAFLEGKFYLGSALGQFTTEEIRIVSHAFQTATLPYEWDAQIHRRLWDKFAINCSINLLTALFSCKNGDLRQHKTTLIPLTQEIAQVLSAHNFPISGEALYLNVTQILNITAQNYSSMYKDVKHKKPTELPYLNEQLVRLAQQKQIETPLTNKLLAQFYKSDVISDVISD